MLRSARVDNQDLKKEMVQIQQSYHLEDVDIQAAEIMEKHIEDLFRRFELLEHKVNGNMEAYSHLSNELLEVKDTIDFIVEEQALLSEKLHALKKR